MKKVVFAFAVALLFISCSDDSGETNSDVVSCKFHQKFYNNDICTEILVKELEEKGGKISDTKAECERESVKGQFSNTGCPSRSVIKCNALDGKIGITYFYDNELDGMTCEEVWAQW
jgi:hypothetical protein